MSAATVSEETRDLARWLLEHGAEALALLVVVAELRTRERETEQ